MIKNQKIINAITSGKIIVNHLWIEATRRCNFDCAHCFHGPAEDVSMSDTTINKILKILDNNYISTISFVGGEYACDIDVFGRLEKALERNKTKFGYVTFVTNGVGALEDLFEISSKIAKLAADQKTIICMSCDDYHRAEYIRLGHDFEKQEALFFELGKKYKDVKPEMIPYQSNQDFVIGHYGNGKELTGITKCFDAPVNHTLFGFKEYCPSAGYAVLEHINFDVHGNIPLPIIEYKRGDKENFGNVHDIKGITELYLKYGRKIGQCKRKIVK